MSSVLKSLIKTFIIEKYSIWMPPVLINVPCECLQGWEMLHMSVCCVGKCSCSDKSCHKIYIRGFFLWFRVSAVISVPGQWGWRFRECGCVCIVFLTARRWISWGRLIYHRDLWLLWVFLIYNTYGIRLRCEMNFIKFYRFIRLHFTYIFRSVIYCRKETPFNYLLADSCNEARYLCLSSVQVHVLIGWTFFLRFHWDLNLL